MISVFRMRWRMEVQYRGAVIGGIFCQVFFGFILVAVYRALYETRPQTMPLESVVTYVWLQQAFFRMLLSSDGELDEKVRTGSIAYDLCRPLSMYWYYYTRGLAQKLVGSIMRAVPMLAVASLLPAGWGIMLPVSVPALIAALVSLIFGLLCVCTLDGITTACTLRTLDGKGVGAMMKLIMMTFSGNILPLTLFPDSWQHVVRLLPYAQLLDAPIRIYTGLQPVSGVAGIWLVQLIWTAVLALLGMYMWASNQKRMIVQGG